MSMMAAAPPFAAHPGAMAGHAGIAHGGHPMAQGHHSNQGMPGGGQPGVTMGQQMHGGVVGPGGPQSGQPGPMMGAMMPAGGPAGVSGNGGPSMHALSHLTPGHPSQMFAQQQQMQQMANNPQFQQQQHALHQAQQMHRIQQQMRMQQQQLAQNGGMALGHGNNPMNPAHFRAGQGNPNVPRPPVSLPNHLQQAQAQVTREQQQQQAHQQQQQLMAMQQAASQSGNNQPQPAPQQQPRPPSQMGGAQDPQAGPSSQHAQMQQQQQQQPPQHTQQQQQPSQQAQAVQQPQQPSQQQPQSQQQAQQQSQSQQSQTQQTQAQQQAHAQAHHAQQQQAAAAMMQRPVQAMKGASVLKLLQFGDQLGNFSTKTQPNDLNFWQNFVERFFSHAGVIRQQLYYSSDQSTTKQYEISPTPTLARYYWTHFKSGVQNIQMIVERFRELDLPNGGHSVTSEKTSFIYWLTNGHQLVTSGRLKVQFDQLGKIDVLEILTTSHEEFVPRAQLLRAATESPDMKHSPNQSKTSGKKAAQQRQKQAQVAQDQPPVAAIPSSTINEQGVTPSVQVFLEVAEATSLMQPLFKFSQSHPGLSATEALHQYTANMQNQSQMMPHPGMNPAIHHQQNMTANLQLPPGQRTPNHFVSPANSAHLALPGQTSAAPSPATLHGMSPAIQNLPLQQQQHALQQAQGPTSIGMAPTMSQPGTNNSVGTGSQGASANASPNMTNKRRRPSAVKGEDEGGGPEVNGVGPSSKVKPSPRIGGKRQKGNG